MAVEYTEEELVVLRKAAAHARSFRTPVTAQAAREHGKRGGRPKGTGKPLSPEHKEALQFAQAARRAREKQSKEGQNSLIGQGELLQ